MIKGVIQGIIVQKIAPSNDDKIRKFMLLPGDKWNGSILDLDYFNYRNMDSIILFANQDLIHNIDNLLIEGCYVEAKGELSIVISGEYYHNQKGHFRMNADEVGIIEKNFFRKE